MDPYINTIHQKTADLYVHYRNLKKKKYAQSVLESSSMTATVIPVLTVDKRTVFQTGSCCHCSTRHKSSVAYIIFLPVRNINSCSSPGSEGS